ncbi:hypothetical protein [Streptomyces sp. NPDC019507]|uniref:hypothetical protein n=1 Tax=Streptomyces sp. NPDC019507 TaxID=3154689 RepID=UPI0033F1D015
MQRTEIDGIAAFWAEGPKPFAGRITFHIGTADETLPQRGLTELVHGLVVDALTSPDTAPRVHWGSVVELTDTAFWAEGEPDRVAALLTSVCRTLADPPVDALPRVARRLQATADCAAPDPAAEHHHIRHGYRGYGRTAYDRPLLAQHTPDDIRTWATRHFVRGNAALSLTGPPPPELHLTLPDGPRHTRPPQRPAPHIGGHWYEHGHEAGHTLSLSFVMPTTHHRPALTIALDRIAREQHTGDGSLGDLELRADLTGDGRTLALITATTDEQGAATAATTLDTTLRTLAQHGPTPQEIDTYRTTGLEDLDNPACTRALVDFTADDHTAGHDHLDTHALRAFLHTLTPDTVHAALADYPRTALLGVPRHTAPTPETPLTPLPPLPAGTLTTADEYRPRLRSPLSRRTRLYIGDEGITQWWPDAAATIPWYGVAGLATDETGTATLYGENGACITYHPDWYRSGDDLHDRIRWHVPPRLRFRERGGEPI